MGHTKRDRLTDIEKELDLIRGFNGMIERKPGIFYLKGTPFLHFHDADETRWADVKKPEGGWTRIEIDFGASLKAKNSFILAVRKAHEKLSAPKVKKK